MTIMVQLPAAYTVLQLLPIALTMDIRFAFNKHTIVSSSNVQPTSLLFIYLFITNMCTIEPSVLTLVLELPNNNVR